MVGVPGPTPFTSSLTPLADPSADANPTSGGIIFVPPSLPTPSLVPMSMPPGLAASLARLKAESHEVRARQSKAMRDDSQTGGTYAWHVARYQAWWEAD